MIEDKDNLLTIKQAAEMLNVSEMSLRRWTNAGKLACLRVGTHRSRRFKREDLLKFLEQQDATDGVVKSVNDQASSSKRETHIILEGLTIDYGNHLCSLYDNALGRQKLSVPLLADGLRKGDICFLVATIDIQNEILEALKAADCDVKTAIENGQLLVMDGEQNKKNMLKVMQSQFILATRSGGKSMRIVGDMSWALAKGWDIDEIIEYESTFNNTLGHQYPVIALCLYNVENFSGSGILGALRCHEDTFQYPLNRFFGAVEH